MATEMFVGDAVFCAAIGFLVGTIAAGLGWNFLSAAIFFAILLVSFLMFQKNVATKIAVAKNALESLMDGRVPSPLFVAIFLAGLAFGFFYYFLLINLRPSSNNLPFGKSTTLTAIVMDEPDVSGKYLLLSADLQKPLSGAVTIFATPGSSFAYGDEVRVTGEIEEPQGPGDDPAVFPKTITIVAHHRGFWLHEALIDFKSAIAEKFNEFLPSDMAGLLIGETLGGMTAIGTALKNEMTVSGTSYVASMYGYKISMIVIFLEEALVGFFARRTRFALIAGVIVLFVGMSGGNISAVRAAIMALLALVAKLAGRVFDPRNALVFTALAMALFDPTLPAQAAFELSFLSIVGIFYLVAPLRNFFRWREHELGFLDCREAVVVAVASLLPIVPIIAAAFGDFSLTAFPSNILIAFGILPALILGATLAIAGYVSYYLAFFIAKLAEIVLWYQLAIIKIFAMFTIPFPFPLNSTIAFVVYYVGLIFFAYRYA